MNLPRSIVLMFLTLGLAMACQTQTSSIELHINIRGNLPVNISVVPTAGEKAYESIFVKENVRPNSRIKGELPSALLPLSFQLRVEFRNSRNGQPTMEEALFFMDNSPVEISINPEFVHIPDSVIFSPKDQLNMVYYDFQKKVNASRETINLLQTLLMRYDRKKSSFYSNAEKEYNQRVKEHNTLVKAYYEKHKTLFSASTFLFYEIVPYNFQLIEKQAKALWLRQTVERYSFNDRRVIHTADFRQWLDNYMNRHFEKEFTRNQSDSALAAAGQILLNAAQKGDPSVYGHVVDYLFNGYESMGFIAGIKILERCVNDPKCSASKKSSIQRRIESLNKIYPGAPAPNFTLTTASQKTLSIISPESNKPYKIVMFWSADCEHCRDFVSQFYPWFEKANLSGIFDVLALSVDITETEISAWYKSIASLPLWEHVRLSEGMASPEVNAYYVLSTPTVFIIDTKTGKIAAIPQSVKDIYDFLNQ